MRVLVTGMSGTGKSTVVAALADRGHLDVDEVVTAILAHVGSDGHTGESRTTSTSSDSPSGP